MDLEFIRQSVPMYQMAVLLALRTVLWGVLPLFLPGLSCNLIWCYKAPVLRRIVNVYIRLSCNTPLLVQLFFLYFDLSKLGAIISPESCAVTGLVFPGSGYMAGAFHSGLESVERGQLEAGLSIGLEHSQIIRYVVPPQVSPIPVPVLCANVVLLIKETSAFSVTILTGLTYAVKDLIGLYYKIDEALLLPITLYFIILLPTLITSSFLKRRLRYVGFGN